VLNAELSTLVCAYLGVVRPLEILLNRVLDPTCDTTALETYLFTDARRWNAASMCRDFKGTMAKYGVAIGIADYRHISTAYGRLFHVLLFPCLVSFHQLLTHLNLSIAGTSSHDRQVVGSGCSALIKDIAQRVCRVDCGRAGAGFEQRE
jgi:hypothetical protein